MKEKEKRGKVNIHFEDGRAVNPVTDALANNLRGVHEVIKDGLVDSSHGPGDRAELEGLSGTPRRLADDAALDDEDHRLSAELLLQLSHQTGLDATELDSLVVGDEDDDGTLLVSLELDLTG